MLKHTISMYVYHMDVVVALVVVIFLLKIEVLGNSHNKFLTFLGLL